MRNYDFTVQTTGEDRKAVQGNMIAYTECTSGTQAPSIQIITDKGDDVVLNPGESVTFPQVFSSIRVRNSDAVVAIVGILLIGQGQYVNNRISGDVTLTQGTTITNVAEKTVGVAEGVVAAASTGRRALRFWAPATNTGTIYLGATGITTANGAVRLLPGETRDEETAAPAAWYAISDVAAQALRVQEIA